MKNSSPKKKLLLKLSLYMALFILCASLFYLRYFLWIDCFNELGRCYNPDGSGQVYTSSAQIWALPALLFLGAFLKKLYDLKKS
ncbi:MAG: hypothetical protein KDK66_06645 [Deltaproteobacteria bacterium]|nr:hypothetical protein [Deltaproteobacteria bacterium]